MHNSCYCLELSYMPHAWHEWLNPPSYYSVFFHKILIPCLIFDLCFTDTQIFLIEFYNSIWTPKNYCLNACEDYNLACSKKGGKDGLRCYKWVY